MKKNCLTLAAIITIGCLILSFFDETPAPTNTAQKQNFITENSE
jgi:hypothetical protein